MTSNKDIFNNIYRYNKWGWGSGFGSIPFLNKPYLDFVNGYISKNKEIKTIVDVGCGDWQLGRFYNLKNKKYIGCDVSDLIIKKVKERYGCDNISFVELDIISDKIPKGDMVIVKDVLMHLKNKDIKKCLLKLARYKHVLVVNDVYSVKTQNREINNGAYRPVDIHLHPFNSKLSIVKKYIEGIRVPSNFLRKIFGMPVIEKTIYVHPVN